MNRVFAHGLTVIGGDDDQGSIEHTLVGQAAFQVVEQAIEERNGVVVASRTRRTGELGRLRRKLQNRVVRRVVLEDREERARIRHGDVELAG